MAVYKDLSEYHVCKHIGKDIKGKYLVKNIGWLGGEKTFLSGKVDDIFLQNLYLYYKIPFFMYTKRILYCNSELDGKEKYFALIYKNVARWLGSSEIRVLDYERKIIYVAPDLIIHYIKNHHYLPPQEFINAVINGPKPNDVDYCDMVAETYGNTRKYKSFTGRCSVCGSQYVSLAYFLNKKCVEDEKILLLGKDDIARTETKELRYFQFCKDCGYVTEYWE